MSDKFTCAEYTTAGLIACAYQSTQGRQATRELNDFASWCLEQSKRAYEEGHEC